MNIVSLFPSVVPEQLLFNTELDVVKAGWDCSSLFREVAAIAHFLSRNHFALGDRFLILSGNRAETYVFSLALWSIGAVAMPVNPLSGKEVLVEIIRRLAPKGCIYEGELNPEIRTVLSRSCKCYIALDKLQERNVDGGIDYKELLRREESIELVNLPGDHPALIIHTSGSQGHPKVIQLSHQNLFNYFHYHDLVHRQFCDVKGTGVEQSPFISVFHPSHLAAYSITLQGMLMRRPTYLMYNFSPRYYLSLLSRLRCRLAVLVPSMYLALLKEKEMLAACDFSALHLCGSVGEPTPVALIEQIESAFDAAVFEGYGLTECLPGIGHSWRDLQHHNIVRGSCGKQLFAELKLVDDSGRTGTFGELWLRNPTVHRCYLDESMNAAKLTEDGWFKTGDLFEKDEAGNFYHRGRIDDMFIINGKNIFPAEIELAFAKHPAVERALAAPLVDCTGGKIAAVLLQTKSPLDETQMIEFYLRVGPLHAVPRFIGITECLPELGPGKIDRNAGRLLLQVIYEGSRS